MNTNINITLNPFTAVTSLEDKIKVQNLKPLSLFVFFFALALERIFIKIHRTERRCYRTGKYTVFVVHPCIFQPGNFTGWGSEGVKDTSMWMRLQGCKRHHIFCMTCFDLERWFLCVNLNKLLFSQLQD